MECAWFERRIALVDAKRQVDELNARAIYWLEKTEGWTRLEAEAKHRHVLWIAADPDRRPRNAPPLRMRLRCWREVIIEPLGGKPLRVMQEGLRGDDERTAARAIERWRGQDGSRERVPVNVQSAKIARRQRVPMPPP